MVELCEESFAFFEIEEDRAEAGLGLDLESGSTVDSERLFPFVEL